MYFLLAYFIIYFIYYFILLLLWSIISLPIVTLSIISSVLCSYIPLVVSISIVFIIPIVSSISSSIVLIITIPFFSKKISIEYRYSYIPPPQFMTSHPLGYFVGDKLWNKSVSLSNVCFKLDIFFMFLLTFVRLNFLHFHL